MTVGTRTLEPGTLWKSLLQATEYALRCNALESIPTESEFVEQNGVRFLVRILAGLARKDKARQQQDRLTKAADKTVNPFLPYDENLFVADVSDTHVCLLNRFNVVDHHLLIVTRAFENQESLLTLRDFEALATCLAEFEGLAFYNAGKVAGASQPHKHLQVIPLPLAAKNPRIPVEPLFASTEFRGLLGTAPGLPFTHKITRLNWKHVASPMETARIMLEHYLAMLNAVCFKKNISRSEIRRAGPYNLLATREWMLLVPRSRECFGSISVNALGFAGALLVRNEQQMQLVKNRGPMTILTSVAVPDPRECRR